MKTYLGCVACVGVLLVACRGETLAVGSAIPNAQTQDATIASTDSGPPGTTFFATDAGVWMATPGEPLSAGPGTTWTGYVGYPLPVGSGILDVSPVTMTLNIASDGAVTGTTYFGGLPLLSPPTDGNIGYALTHLDGVAIQNIDPFDNFPFTIVDGAFDGTQLSFRLEPNELFAQWCLLQTSYPLGYGAYGCLPHDGYGPGPTPPSCALYPPDAASIPVDCNKLELCVGQPVCTCNASGCYVPTSSPATIVFDLTVEGTTATGTVLGIAGVNTEVDVYFLEGDTEPVLEGGIVP